MHRKLDNQMTTIDNMGEPMDNLEGIEPLSLSQITPEIRSGPREGERMALSELPDGRGNMKDEPSFSCSFFCVLAEQEIDAKSVTSSPEQEEGKNVSHS